MSTLQPATTSSQEPALDEHEEHGDFRLFGLALFLVADGMTFAGLFAAYLTFRAVNPLPAGGFGIRIRCWQEGHWIWRPP